MQKNTQSTDTKTGNIRGVWCTLVMLNDKYSVGAAVLARTLRDLKTKYPIWCMVDDSVSEECVEFLSRHFDKIVRVPLITHAVVPMKSKKQNQIYGSWIHNSFTKWNVMNPELFPVDKVIQLDADMLFIENCDELFDVPAPAATFSSPWAVPYMPRGIPNVYGEMKHGAVVPREKIRRGLKSGILGLASMVIVQPDKKVYDRMLSLLNGKKLYGHTNCISGFDEQLFAETYILSTMRHIHQQYNWIVGKTKWLKRGQQPKTWQYYNEKPWQIADSPGQRKEKEKSAWDDVLGWWKIADKVMDSDPNSIGWFYPAMRAPTGGKGKKTTTNNSKFFADLAEVTENGKSMENLVATFDPLYDDTMGAIDIVTDFITKHNLILYGGTAIDYALRLKGEKIYPDDSLKVPDLDFYSPNSVKHSYELADLVYAKGYTGARAITATHPTTQRVDMGDNHWIADISYRPREIFDKIPYLEYNGMRISHPDFQRIDQHSALAFPYDDAPREVITARWNKDITRFNILANSYPIVAEGPEITPRKVTVDGLNGSVFTGFAAYAIVYNEFLREMKATGETSWELIIPAFASADATSITFDTLDQRCDVVHFNPQKLVDSLGLTDVARYEHYINLLLGRVEGKMGSGTQVVIYNTYGKLITVNSVEGFAPKKLRITNIQFLMKYFLSMYFVTKDSPKTSSTYLRRYTSLLEMIRIIGENGLTEGSITLPSVVPYGSVNITDAGTNALNYLYHDLRGDPLQPKPTNYYPSRVAGHPEINMAKLIAFRESGKLIAEVLNVEKKKEPA